MRPTGWPKKSEVKGLDPHGGPMTSTQAAQLNKKKMASKKPTSADLINTALKELPQANTKVKSTINDVAKTKKSKPIQDPSPAPKRDFPIPLQDRIIVSKKRRESTTAGGIIIPETVLPKECEGIVVAVGPTVGLAAIKAFNENPDLKTCDYPRVGDKVFFGEYAGTKCNYGYEEYLIMKEADIMAILPE